MASYDPLLRRKRKSINDPLAPLPNYLLHPGTDASPAAFDAGVERQKEFNIGMAKPGGLSPFYGNRSYTQEAQQSKPMTPMFSGGMPRMQAHRPIPTYDAAPAPSPVPVDPMVDQHEGGAPVPAQNAIQRWQGGGTSLDRRPGVQPHFTAGQLRRGYTGRIGGTAMPSPQDRPLGFTPNDEWEGKFVPRLRQNTPGSARRINGRAPYLWET